MEEVTSRPAPKRAGMTWVWSGSRGGTAFGPDRVTSRRPERALEIVLLDPGWQAVGRLRFQVCPDCRTGRILAIWVGEDWQRQGLGREALHSLCTLHPGHRWSTTTQSPQGRAFFAAMAREAETGFPAAGPLCPHLRGWLRRLVYRALGPFLPA